MPRTKPTSLPVPQVPGPQPCPFCGKPVRLVRLVEGDLVVLDLTEPTYLLGNPEGTSLAKATKLWSAFVAHARLCPGIERVGVGKKPKRKASNV